MERSTSTRPSSAGAQERIRAGTYYDIEHDGLAARWRADRMLLNPPYSYPKPWYLKLAEAFRGWREDTSSDYVGAAAVFVPDRALCTVGGSALLTSAKLLVIPRKRIRFVRPDGTTGKGANFGVMLALGGRALDDRRALGALHRHLSCTVWRT